MYQITIDQNTKVNGSDRKNYIVILQNNPHNNETNSVVLTFEELAKIVNWANRKMGALVLSPKKK